MLKEFKELFYGGIHNTWTMSNSIAAQLELKKMIHWVWQPAHFYLGA